MLLQRLKRFRAPTTFPASFSNFEKVGIDQVTAGNTATVNLANLKNIDYVVSAGTSAATGLGEVQLLSVNAVAMPLVAR